MYGCIGIAKDAFHVVTIISTTIEFSLKLLVGNNLEILERYHVWKWFKEKLILFPNGRQKQTQFYINVSHFLFLFINFIIQKIMYNYILFN